MAHRHTETRQKGAAPRGQGERITSQREITRWQLESSSNREYGGWLGYRQLPLARKMRQQALALCFYDSVAFTTKALELRAIQHSDTPPAITDHAQFLQLTSSIGHAFAPHAEHVGYELVCHNQLIGIKPIEREK